MSQTHLPLNWQASQAATSTEHRVPRVQVRETSTDSAPRKHTLERTNDVLSRRGFREHREVSKHTPNKSKPTMGHGVQTLGKMPISCLKT